MFELTLLDHLRLTFGHVVYRHKIHSQIAHSRIQRGRWLRGAEALLMAGVSFTALGAAFARPDPYSVASALMAIIALAVVLLLLIFDLDGSARAHGMCAARLWQIRERYQALLSDLVDGAINIDKARDRRDRLMEELHAIYENAPPSDHRAFQSAAKTVVAADDAPLSDEEIDSFLPKSLQKAGKPTPVSRPGTA